MNYSLTQLKQNSARTVAKYLWGILNVSKAAGDKQNVQRLKCYQSSSILSLSKSHQCGGYIIYWMRLKNGSPCLML